MAVIWGLDLHEIQFYKFKGKHMFSRVYHLRRTRMIVYQLAMILCVCSESVGTAALSDYLDQQSYIQGQHPGVKVHNNSFIGAASYNIFVGISVATIFGAAFFFDLFWPDRYESPSVRLAWKICAVVVSIMMLSSALLMTVVTAMYSARITGTDATSAKKFWSEAEKKPALAYRTNPKAVASAVLAWPGWVATTASTVVLFMSKKHDDQYGAKSKYGRSLENGGNTPELEVKPFTI
ncbi:hypothetical protein BDV32DRAFT_121425 [Aspergillus pseudonomiae]|uniref:Uncharacterized protein n=1 Tax=Aspergillus pseudonomiae TaxID=1506151 RepID=A0A5N7D2K0_9EURO|nr:uncharacterized protein BDV37DRAFT_257996 [Aspergillus pseudonomiae]KAB8261501.1 hypothetical protein BDV32DRAFT_121425 [Aspergillus pseudonomiae]KAE8400357.1 hypothetical protein BDV37DRAFT_257996 [Aspergillus pseudonomiae]